jgi:hypothetical protein
MDEVDIPLSKEEETEKINFLKLIKFEDFKIHKYFNDKGYFKHGVDLEDVKEIYYKFENIISVFKRPAKKGYKYSFRYKIEETKTLILCFYLDEVPPKFFNAYYDYTKQDKKLKKKFHKWMLREINKKK